MMTEQEWMESTDRQEMLEYLRGKASERKLRLVGVASCRRIWHRLTCEGSRTAVILAERYADGLASPEDMTAAWQGVNEARDLTFAAQADHRRSKSALAYYAASAAYELNNVPPPGEERVQVLVDIKNACSWAADAQPRRKIECRAQGGLIREVFGNPFRPVTVDPAWQSDTVVSLATTIYSEKAFDRLPLLADALEDAGCTNADILNHCRQPGEHVRGCWVVDLLLGKM